MHKTRIDLPAKTRAKLIALLNARLADAIDLQLQAKQAHWNVKGPNFIALHGLFDTLAGELGGPIDDLAERITALGGVAEGTVQVVGARSKLDAYPLELTEGLAHARGDALLELRGGSLGKGEREDVPRFERTPALWAEELDDATGDDFSLARTGARNELEVPMRGVDRFKLTRGGVHPEADVRASCGFVQHPGCESARPL